MSRQTFKALVELPWYVTIAEGIAGERLQLFRGKLGHYEGVRFIGPDGGFIEIPGRFMGSDQAQRHLRPWGPRRP